MKGTLWRIVAPHFVAGLIVDHGRVAQAAPILRWAEGRRWGNVRRYLKAQGWHGDPL